MMMMMMLRGSYSTSFNEILKFCFQIIQKDSYLCFQYINIKTTTQLVSYGPTTQRRSARRPELVLCWFKHQRAHNKGILMFLP